MPIDFSTFLPEKSLKRYTKLNDYINKLLSKVRAGFKGIHEDYLFFLGYLVENVEYSRTIKNIDNTLILLLYDIDKFWIADNNLNSMSTVIEPNNNKEIKQNIIKWIILQHMISVVNGTAAKHNKNVAKFLENQTAKLELLLLAQQAEIKAIFLHEINFLHRNKLQLTFFRDNYQFFLYTCLIVPALHLPSTIRLLLRVYHSQTSTVHENLSLRQEFIMLQDSFDTILSLTALLIAGVFGNFNGYIKKPHHHFLQKLYLDRFIFTFRNHEFLKLLVPKAREIDTIWFENSLLSGLETKEPIMFRTYVHKELQSLKTEETMTTSLLISLLHALVITEKTPQLRDVPYSIPIELLAKPELFWLKYTVLKPIQYRKLLQQYTKLAMIEFMNEQLETFNNRNTGKKDIVIIGLETQRNQIVQSIRDLNGIQTNRAPMDDLIKSIAIGTMIFSVALISITFLIFHYSQKSESLNPEPDNSFGSKIAIGVSIAAAITTCMLFRTRKVETEEVMTMKEFIFKAKTELPESTNQTENNLTYNS